MSGSPCNPGGTLQSQVDGGSLSRTSDEVAYVYSANGNGSIFFRSDPRYDVEACHWV